MKWLTDLRWDWTDWSLSRVTARWPDGRAHVSEATFALKCGLCRRWSWGCVTHWFCGCCEPCRQHLEHDDDECA